MPAERITMRHAREIIRLKFSSVSTHEIARRLGMARSTVREALKRTETAGGVVTLLFEERERTTPYGFSSRRDGLTPCGHRRGA